MLKFFILSCLCVSTAYAYPDWFNEYKIKHRKNYDVEEEEFAFNILKEKQWHVENHRWKLNIQLNEHSDKNRTNFLNRKIGMPKNSKYRLRRQRIEKSFNPPTHFDWRTHNYVTPPKSQGDCGGCFAFAATAQFEFWYKKRTGKILPFSVQQALDCSHPQSDGCNGGLMEDVYKHAQYNPMGPEYFDEYKNSDYICKKRRKRPYVKTDTYSVMSDQWNDPIEDTLPYNLLKYGPIPVGVDSSHTAFELYEHGILRKDHCGKNLDHAVVVVGYTPDYWIVKNSWGTNWGQDGYFYLERGKNACGINSYASFMTSVNI